ncbi:hypothetical protein IFM89_011680 [Coptis chinensis]|uniref:Exostosin GT47 domain-containing protein n=1 Tax=Coptis chinensis TaxID=261450 RepID=A0A835LU50_9MAGN|nr:hypothetical protein IFM89_011680 [Coptis chinensis]
MEKDVLKWEKFMKQYQGTSTILIIEEDDSILIEEEKVLTPSPLPQIPISSPPLQPQTTLKVERSKKRSLAIVDYGHDETAMSPEPEAERVVQSKFGIIIKRSGVIVMFWFLLFYFHFVVLGNGSVDDSGVKLPSSTNPSRVDGVPEVRVGKELNKKDRVKENFQFMKALKAIENKSDPCGGRYIYVHDLPPKFNEDMLKECKSISLSTNMCTFTSNVGLGPPLENVERVFSNLWMGCCLCSFYVGLEISRYLWGYNISVRDAASLELVDWLAKRPEWSVILMICRSWKT